MVLLQVVGAILLMFGSLLVLWAVCRMEQETTLQAQVRRPRLVVRAKARNERLAELPRAA